MRFVDIHQQTSYLQIILIYDLVLPVKRQIPIIWIH